MAEIQEMLQLFNASGVVKPQRCGREAPRPQAPPAFELDNPDHEDKTCSSFFDLRPLGPRWWPMRFPEK